VKQIVRGALVRTNELGLCNIILIKHVALPAHCLYDLLIAESEMKMTIFSRNLSITKANKLLGESNN
jgi:hypothetical protein